MALTLEDIKTFMAPVKAEAANIIQLMDADGDPAVDNVALSSAAVLTYGQVAAYTNRDFALTTFVDRYFNIPCRMELRCLPVVSVTEVKYEDTILVEDTDYEIEGNFLKFVGSGANVFVYGVDEVDVANDYLYSELKISYSAGLATADLDYQLYTALTFQLVANYRRRDIVGLSKVLLAGPTAHSAEVSSDTGQIVQSARIILDKLIYYGDFEPC